MAFSFNFDICSGIKKDCNNDTLNEKEENGNQDKVKKQREAEVNRQLAVLEETCCLLLSPCLDLYFCVTCFPLCMLILRLQDFYRVNNKSCFATYTGNQCT